LELLWLLGIRPTRRIYGIQAKKIRLRVSRETACSAADGGLLSVSFLMLLSFYLSLSIVPFPGVDWLESFKSSSSLFTHEDKTYSSIYDAFLDGSPLSNPCRNFNAYINSFLFSSEFAETIYKYVPSLEGTHYILCYLRNFVGALIVYYGTALVFHYNLYVHPRSQEIFENRVKPSSSIIWDQIKLAQASMFLYVGLPVLDEFLIESNYTRVYYTMDEIGGWHMYLATMLLYFVLVEIGIYWMHRKLHTNKWLYKNIHQLHHKYNAPEQLTPWCSIAFHPIDGILQASPYVVALFICPCHYITHVGLLFFTAIWATYIHDSMDFNILPIMGSKYHTVHHTHYIYNYGQVFVFCDYLFGTYKLPEGPTGMNGKYIKKKEL
jgi:lathosterol oxidase